MATAIPESEDFGSKGNTESSSPTTVCSQEYIPDFTLERARLRRSMKHGGLVHFRGFGPSVQMQEISQFFGKVGEVTHIEMYNHIYVGCGCVWFRELEQAKKAVELFDYYVYKGKLIRVYGSELDSKQKKDVRSKKVIIKNLPSVVDEIALREIGQKFGTVISCKFNPEGSPRDGYRYAEMEFEKEEVAAEFIQKLDGMLLDDQVVNVSPFDLESKSQEEEEERERLRRTVVVSNLSESVYELEKYFYQFGYVTNVVIESDADGHSKGVGSVSYRKVEDADRAVKMMDGYEHDNKVWSVKKSPISFEQEKTRKFDHLQDGRIQVKNLQGFVSNGPLQEMFSDFGPINDCKVMLDNQGQSIGTGIVSFSTPADATRAVNAMNGKVIAGRPLSVSLLEHKDEKKARAEVAILG